MRTAPGQPLGAADRLKKLRAMSPGELWTRVRYEAYCRLERRRHARGNITGTGQLRDSLARHLAQAPDWRVALLNARRGSTRRFFSGAVHGQQTRALFASGYPLELERARVEANRALGREFSFFGGTHHYPDRVDWHADPVTRREWPAVYHRDVPVHGGDVGFGDVKHVWELNRHQFLIDLAKAWALDRDPRYARAARELISDWRARNAVGTGVSWSCSLEPAFRVLSWLWAYYLTSDEPGFDDASHLDWLEGFHEHGWFLYRHLEYYTSPFNHLAGEACALYCLGVLFPEFAEASRWRAHGRDVLESRLTAQFYADGGSVEQSTFYHHATTGFYLLAALLGRANDEEFSPAVWAAIERAIEFSAALQQPDGTTPRIGGADDGKPIRLEQRRLWDFRPYQAIGAVVFARPDFKAAAGRFFEDALWLLGPEGAARFEALPSEAPSPVSRALESSGYVIVRDRWAPDAHYLCFDCGEQAAGLRRDAIPSAAHGHADCLSVIVWRQGRPVLVDPGLYCYNGPKAWQDHFRETAAHSTVRIDGRDQAQHINKMAWSHTYAVTLEGRDLSGSSRWAVASHDGYRRLPSGGVQHRRAIWVRDRGYLVICDFLEGVGTHDVEVTFQFAPGPLAVGDTAARFDERAELHWFASRQLCARVWTGGEAPEHGWIAPSLGVREAAPRLVLSAALEMPATVMTVLTDTRPASVAVSSGPPGAREPITVSSAGWSDVLVARGLNAGTHDLETDALLAAWSREGDRLIDDGHVGGTFQRREPTRP